MRETDRRSGESRGEEVGAKLDLQPSHKNKSNQLSHEKILHILQCKLHIFHITNNIQTGRFM